MRAELFITSALIASIHHFGTSLTKIPILGIDLQTPISPQLLLVGLWAFWIYIAAALILRTWSENQRTIGPDLLLERAAKSLEQAFQDLQSTTAAAITPNFADTNAHLQKAINALPSGPAKDYVEST